MTRATDVRLKFSAYAPFEGQTYFHLSLCARKTGVRVSSVTRRVTLLRLEQETRIRDGPVRGAVREVQAERLYYGPYKDFVVVAFGRNEFIAVVC